MLEATHSLLGVRATAATHSLSGQSTVAVTSRNNAASITDRVIRPLTPSPCYAWSCGSSQIRLRCGFRPNLPHQVDGTRIDPPPSDLSIRGDSPATTAAQITTARRHLDGDVDIIFDHDLHPEQWQQFTDIKALLRRCSMLRWFKLPASIRREDVVHIQRAQVGSATLGWLVQR
ncbi:hypothetical protein [Mycobacterium uberis]|uniref:hypothetical protein n=1 Tax=Mycobacterium uberis TaxID=2162698 RepID=UPI001FB20D3D|nr:hypothetical protein [Mycobacterium uberis]